tara:strand:- start:2773 stop:3288 length:516 start_codon:yes stop_codon:yes gene_type:complete
MRYIIVLGNRTQDIMEKRVLRALKEFYGSPYEYIEPPNSLPTKMLLFSGGSSDGVSNPEGAVMMHDFALTKGVDEKFVVVEDKSRTTVENLVNCKEILERYHRYHHLGCRPTITICTSTFHIRRAIVLSKLILPEYELSFIHTEEKVPENIQRHEWNLLVRYLDNMCEAQM